MELPSRDNVAAGLCPDCTVDQYEVLNENGRFFASCRTCGKRGPEASSLYEATQGWKQMLGAPAQSMSAMVLKIAGALCVLAMAVAVIAWVVD